LGIGGLNIRFRFLKQVPGRAVVENEKHVPLMNLGVLPNLDGNDPVRLKWRKRLDSELDIDVAKANDGP